MSSPCRCWMVHPHSWARAGPFHCAVYGQWASLWFWLTKPLLDSFARRFSLVELPPHLIPSTPTPMRSTLVAALFFVPTLATAQRKEQPEQRPVPGVADTLVYARLKYRYIGPEGNRIS